MVIYHSSGVTRKLVKYTEKYYPKALLIIRPKDTIENRERGYRSGQPDILLLERRCKYMGLAIWATSEMSKSKTMFLRKLRGKSYETIVSDDYDDLRLYLDMYMARCGKSCPLDIHQLSGLSDRNNLCMKSIKKPGKYTPLDSSGYRCIQQLVENVRGKYPSSVLIPGLGVDGQPDLTIISPNSLHDGLAIWVDNTRNRFSGLSHNQLGFLRRMACRSYVIIVCWCPKSITRDVDCYMWGEYKYCQRTLTIYQCGDPPFLISE